jgi:hypothetical protein
MLHDSTQGCKDNTRRRNQLSGRTLANRPRRQIDNVWSWRRCRMRGHGSGQDQVINRHCKDSAFYAGPIRCRLGSVFYAHDCKRGRPHSGEFGCEPSDCTWPICDCRDRQLWGSQIVRPVCAIVNPRLTVASPTTQSRSRRYQEADVRFAESSINARVPARSSAVALE